MLTAKLSILEAYGLLWTMLATSTHARSFSLISPGNPHWDNQHGDQAVSQAVCADVSILSNLFAMATLYSSI